MTVKNNPQLTHLQELYDAVRIPVCSELGCFEEKMLPADDGVKLRTMYWFPKEPVCASTIVVRCCYPQQEESLKIKAIEHVKRGFGFIVQWCRGTGGSEGIWEPNVNDRADGLNLMRSLQDDPRVKNMGYWGDSYLAFTGWVMADAVPDKVKTMFLGVYGCDRHTSAYKHGLFRQDILTAWAMGNAGRPITADYMESAAFRPQVHVDVTLWGGKLQWYRDWITNTDRDCNYWNSGFWKDLIQIPGKVKFPVFVKEGWYDHHLGSAMVTFELLSPEARKHSVLQIGPWNHGYGAAVQHQPLDNLVDDAVSTPMEWFDRILRKEELPEPEARLYMIGKDEWITLPGWPVHNTDVFKAYLSENQTLTAEPDTADHQVQFTYDPKNPVISYGAESLFNTKANIGSLPQPEPGYRDDVVTYLSQPLEKELNICGTIKVKLTVSSSAEDTSFTAKLMEVFEDGTAVNIRGTITTLAYRNDVSKRITYTPNTPVDVTLEMWPVAWKTQKNSRLRLDIGSSDFPQYAVHGNKIGPWSLQEETITAEQTIHTLGAEPSCIELPLLD